MAKKSTTEEFIRKAKEKHGDRYDYSLVEYVNNSTKVKIICKEHGVFEQKPDKHLIGQGCPKCASTLKGTSESFIEKARKIHGDEYDYSKVEYINNREKVIIICKEHGEFTQTPHNHLKGQGCPICGKDKGKNIIPYEVFLEKAKAKYGDTYIYPPKEKYVKATEEIPIICRKHGEFMQQPYTHLHVNGCPRCGIEQNGFNKRLTTEEFIEKAKKVHGDKYDYSKTEYITAKKKVIITCPTHGDFTQMPYHHLQGCGCPQCNHYKSKQELEIYNFICNKVGSENVVSGDRSVLNGRELDIYIPQIRVAIEFNGLYWHNTDIVPKNYHLEKLNECKSKGVKLLQIFEDEYYQKREIVYKKIEHILGLQDNLPRIMGRKCKINVIDANSAKEFLNAYHIQGHCSSTVYLGAVYNGALVAVMAFKQETKGSLKWELTRFASNYDYICQGIGGKLFKYFINNYECDEIKSFADRRWTIDEENNIYVQLGFNFNKYTNVEYRYYDPKGEGCIRIHKFNCRIHTLNRKFGLPLTMTERQMTESLGYKRVYDCGLIKYVWNRVVTEK